MTLVLGPLNSLKISRGYGWRIHCGVEVTELSTNKQRTPVSRRSQLVGGWESRYPVTPT
jgi:hypothetical protein